MKQSLAGKVAVVTGASKGIGAGIAKGLARAGAAVVVNYSSSKEGADRIVSEITGEGGKAIAVQGDVGHAGDVERLFRETAKAFGPVSVVVNNAGVYRFDPVESVTEEEFHRQFGTNVWGPILTTREALKHFSGDGGSIINISSIVGKVPVAYASVYSSTKGALDSLTAALALELGPRKIRVNAVSPGMTETEGAHTLGIIGSERATATVAVTPLGRLGQPEDIASVVVFLASDEAAWITGENIRAAGGKI
ncbi:SDR family NAD(P)-dependent oxidoreductase [Dinghuibacter silviterrae]|uniref:3-oxoacyl-[acyl-carrier protein] reductase n=1 Tax=Dinghuibacter silviterrae TaxID=1539049 RepID=A0A4R8DPN5_9BACT|nr:glucose 1-dehydrogenase [Dinghuibacter silviterrae]TDW99374.1 3-oxoacyl-[acyl-carrier protein] reductase [Dinghuibacter silviterrae]